MMMKILGTSEDEYKLHLLRIEKNIQLLYDIASLTVFYSLIILCKIHTERVIFLEKNI